MSLAKGLFAGGVVGSLATAGIVAGAYRLRTRETSPLGYIPRKHTPHVKPFQPRGELKFTYYRSTNRFYDWSFFKISGYQAEMLRQMDYKVEERNLYKYLRDLRHPTTKFKNDFAIVHPLFFTTPKALDYLEKQHRYIVAFEVADTTHINNTYAEYANDERINAICLPSYFAMWAYRNSGVINRLAVVPHGLDTAYRKKPQEIKPTMSRVERLRTQFNDKIKICTFIVHSSFRKGADVVTEAVNRLVKKRRDVLLVIKTGLSSTWTKVRCRGILTYPITGWLSEEDIISIYDSCDIYLSPYRGGGFELNPLEAMGRGLPTVVTGGGSALEYANFHNAYLIKPTGLVKVFQSGAHTGYGFNPDVDHCVELLEFVIDNLDYCKKRARTQSKALVERYSWENAVKRFLEVVEEVWESD